VNVGDAGSGSGVDVGGGWMGGTLVGLGVGDSEGMTAGVGGGEGITVKVGRGVVGVGSDATGVGTRGWRSTGRSPSASTKAAISVSSTTPTATRLTRIGRQRNGLVFCPSG
jgi:hypothetical protein